MNEIEIMKANQAKYINLAKAEKEELLKNKADAERYLEEEDFLWLGVALEKMLRNNREILRHNQEAKRWEMSANIVIKEREIESSGKMMIKKNTIYQFTSLGQTNDFFEQVAERGIKWLKDDFFEQAEKKGMVIFGPTPRHPNVPWHNGDCVLVDHHNCLTQGPKLWFQKKYPEIPIVEWEIR